MTHFSERSHWPSDLHAFRPESTAIDLTVSLPGVAGLSWGAELNAALHEVDVHDYSPDPLGEKAARAAVCDYYRARHADYQPDQVMLTASTSEAYSHLFALLCDPGDEVWVAAPSYPLLDDLAQLSGVRLRRYALQYDGDWHCVVSALDTALQTSRAQGHRPRVLVCVSPNNPTGHYLKPDEYAALQSLCAQQQMALLMDEVFADYPLSPQASPAIHPPAIYHWKMLQERAPPVLTVRMSGLSKVAALPQLKLAWSVVAGPGQEEAMRRLQIIADTYLSVAGPVQKALPRILAQAPQIQRKILERLSLNAQLLTEWCQNSAAQPLPVEGGFMALLRLPAVLPVSDGEASLAWALTLQKEAGVVTQPGEWYGLAGPYVALSLLTPPPRWADGIRQILDYVRRITSFE